MNKKFASSRVSMIVAASVLAFSTVSAHARVFRVVGRARRHLSDQYGREVHG